MEKRRMLTEVEVKAVVDQWVDNRSEEELDQQVVKKEIQKLEKKLARYNVSPVGHTNEDKGEGTCRILYSQLNNASTRVARDIKMDKIHSMNEKYQVASEKPFKGLTIREVLEYFSFSRRREYKNGLYTLKQRIEFKGTKRGITGTFEGIW